jgi:hypothetical protein
MEFTLNLKKRGKIFKTYTATTYDLTLGVCEDLLNLLKLENLIDDEGVVKDINLSHALQLIVKNFDQFIEILHEVFPDLTEEERRYITVYDFKDIIVAIAKDTLHRLFKFNEKN